MTRPDAMAVRRTESESTVSSRTSRAAPASTSEIRTPGRSLRPPRVAVTLDPHDESAAAARRELVDGTGHHQTAVVDDRHLFAEVLDQIELVAREQHAAPGLCPFDQDLPDGVDSCRVQSGQGLVEHQELGVVDEGGGQLDTLLVSMRERLDLAVGPIDDVETLQPHPRRPCRVRFAQTVQSSQVLNLLADEHRRVEAPFLGHVAEPSSLGLADRSPVPAHLSRVEVGQSEDRPHRGRLTSAVGPEESHDVPRGDFEGQIVEGSE